MKFLVLSSNPEKPHLLHSISLAVESAPVSLNIKLGYTYRCINI